jgi:hypothetical protein
MALACAAVLFFISLEAAPPYRNNTAPSGWVFNLFSAFSYVNYFPQPGTLAVSFPYSLTARNSPLATTHTFSSERVNLTGTGKWVYPGLGLEIGKENFTVEARMGLYRQNWSDHLYGGLSYRFILRKAHSDPERLALGSVILPGKNFMRGAASFPVKISAGLFYYQPIWSLGTIDIGSDQFRALGHTMQSLDSANRGSTGNVTVYFHQNILAFTPTFSLGFQPDGFPLYVNFSVAPLITLSEAGGLRFYLRNSDNVEWAPENGINLESLIPLNSAGMDATFNGEELNASPFHLKGVMYTLRVGIKFAN